MRQIVMAFLDGDFLGSNPGQERPLRWVGKLRSLAEKKCNERNQL